MALELGGMRGQGRGQGGGVGVVEKEVEAAEEVRWRSSTGLGNDCAVWKQDGRSTAAHSVAGRGSAASPTDWSAALQTTTAW